MGKRVKREWKKKKHGKGSLTPHTSILGAGQQRLQIILHKSKVSHSFHRENHCRNTFLGLCSPQTLLIVNGLYSEEHGMLTWESTRNYEKYNTLHFMVLYENDRTGSQKPGSPHPRWLAATLGLSIMFSKEEERLILENKWSLNTSGLLFYLICTAQLFPSFPLKLSMSFYLKPKQYTVKFY